MDWVIKKASESGIQLLLYPIYLRYKDTDEGWIEQTLANGPENSLDYGRYVGRRHKDFDKVIWMMGADRDPGPALQDVDMVALGIKEYDRRHVFSAECAPEHSAVDYYSGGRWLDFSTTYTYGIVHTKLLQDYNSLPNMPFVLIESSYEGEHNASEVQIRRQAYWAVLCGGFGHVMGNHPIDLFDPGWQAATDLPGSVGMESWGELFRSRSWCGLIPDQKLKEV